MSDASSANPISDQASVAQLAASEKPITDIQALIASDPESALAKAEELLRTRSDPRLFRLAAEACRALGLEDDAVEAELAAIQAGLSDPQLRRAAEAQSDGRPAEAAKIAGSFLQARPDDLLAQTVAAQAAIALWDLDQAEALLRDILKRAPTFLRASMLLATCLANQLRMRDAISVLSEVAQRKPTNVPVLSSLAQHYAEVGDLDQTTKVHEKLTALDPARPERWINLGQYYRIVGRKQDAVAALRHALSLDNAHGSAWWGLANYFSSELDAGDETAIRSALAARAGTIDEGPLHIALGLVADRSGDRAGAFEHIAAGKQLRLASHPYDPQQISDAVDGVINSFTRGFYGDRRRWGYASDAPIFIVGMPRSGTTLVERILGRHPAIEGSGELQIMRRLAEIARRKADNPENYAALLSELPDAEIGIVGDRYVRASADYRRTNKPHFIDKNNLNWLQVALVLIALPDAKILDVRRNALDCCWANFKMLFAESFPAANDLRHVGRIYADYVRLLEAMKAIAPDRILAVQYEGVVEDLEGSTRTILDFLDLPFEADCLDFHLSQDAVATASSEQVRQPINRKGIGSADPYRPWLGPLLEELGPLADS